nr:hypothetical protein [Tanacetum cinerariifolium]
MTYAEKSIGVLISSSKESRELGVEGLSGFLNESYIEATSTLGGSSSLSLSSWLIFNDITLPYTRKRSLSTLIFFNSNFVSDVEARSQTLPLVESECMAEEPFEENLQVLCLD